MRPSQFAKDDSTDYDVIKHAVDNIDCGDMIVYLRPTTPIRTTGLIGEAIQMATQACDKITGMRSVEEMPESAYKNFIIDFGFLKPLFGTMADTNICNQLHPKTYKANGYVDIILPKQGKLPPSVYGDMCIPFITPKTIDIDTIEDFEYAEWVMRMR